jgi:ABC-type lipoprotein export system ATPase subunit
MMLSVKELTFSYSSRNSFVFPDLYCPGGNNLLVHGASGSGKTSLLHLISGILRPLSGSIRVNNTEITALSARALDRFRGQHIGMIFQQHYFFRGMDVIENLVAAQKLSGSEIDKKYLDKLMHDFDIYLLKNTKPEALSQGEQQRFSIARALANKPLLVLADEPTSSLDDQNCTTFVDMIKRSKINNHASWVIATHDNRLKEHFDNVYSL